MKIFVSNINALASIGHLKNLFSEFGFVKSIFFLDRLHHQCLITMDETTEGVTLLEIFEAQYSEDRKVYPISVDGYYMMGKKRSLWDG